jgi:hypothetical protein
MVSAEALATRQNCFSPGAILMTAGVNAIARRQAAGFRFHRSR